MYLFLLVEAFLVGGVVGLDLGGADDVDALALLAAHVAVDDVVLDLLAVVAKRETARFQVGEEAGAVALELGGELFGDRVVHVARRDLAFVVLAELLHDKRAVHEVADDLVLHALEFLGELLLVARIAADLGQDGRELAANVVHGDDLGLDHGGDAVGEAQVEAVVQRGDRRGRRRRRGREHLGGDGCGGGEEAGDQQGGEDRGRRTAAGGDGHERDYWRRQRVAKFVPN